MDQNQPTDIDAFLQDLQRQELSINTMDSYRLDLANFSRWFSQSNGESFTAKTTTPTDLRDYKAHLIANEKRSPATVNRRLAALRKFFLWAKAMGLVSEIPTDSVKGVASTPRAPKSLPKKDVDRLVREAQKDRNKRNLAIVQLLKNTGIRVGELVKLRTGDIEIGERKGQLVVRSGKGSKYRVVPLNQDARRAITAYQQVRPSVATDFLFIGQRGGALTPRAVELVIRKLAGLAGLENVTPHTLRHTFGKQALDAGVNLVAVARLLGHDRLETTAIYTQPSHQDLEDAVEKLSSEQ